MQLLKFYYRNGSPQKLDPSDCTITKHNLVLSRTEVVMTNQFSDKSVPTIGF